MHIAEVRAYVLKLAHDQVYLGRLDDGSELTEDRGYVVRAPWRSLYASRFETLLVAITASDGTTGWGEALAPVGPEIPAEIVSRLLRPTLIGARVGGVRPAWHRLRDLMRERGHLTGHQADALAAVDIALWDLLGRQRGVPVAELLGGAFRGTVPAYVSGLPADTDEARAALAADWAARGVTLIKLHLGRGVREDLATVDAVLAADERLRVAVDAHWAYGVSDAARLGTALQRRERVAFLEAPLAPEDVEGHRELQRRLDLPVAIGETLRNAYEFRHWLDRRALRVAQPDVARTGLTEALSIAELAAAHHVPVAPHHSVGLGVATAAGLHLAAALPDMPYFEYQPTTWEAASRVLRAPLVGTPGTGLPLPEGPGLGVDIDEDFVIRHATVHPSAHRSAHHPSADPSENR
ncbi:mandelate racemase/muconate lactonizing enzyme family protein [Streptomyces radicis]|uniref:Mandelate racemase/muconate lactonizing enzyme family protein n=1 Tax=Streptomyces radicis TaxID=1750517 RepID=A0A3A9W2D2_9ACTN|nr:mandelate racemase/muconate lactonizing enzyme family protein [Streptomyces radicis]RKN07395.1 mandelate racemase/muconate lactonizing enzyme family protein [Streptomyces radicis]RKN19586.1 mandelate racemase/muconate lactonizing enzyme family protein [Streptomyces radicis]